MRSSVLVLGSGGREHALAWKLAESNQVDFVFVAPGNAGTELEGGKICNTALNIKSHDEIIKFCQQKSINLVVVGPEDPLANGIANDLKKAGINCFGPSKEAAQLESSKDFAKQFMDRHKISTAKWKSFTNASAAKEHIRSAPYRALVVKASGLAAGKGVIVAHNVEEACQAVDDLLNNKNLGEASATVVIEELLEGEEVSILAFTDGTSLELMPPSQDHKQLLEGDKGPNTGGMGAYCPCPQVDSMTLQYIKQYIMEKTIEGMKKENKPFVGVLYAGLMMTNEGPKVLEYNCRFGDPETEVILPLLKSDLYSVMMACIKGKLDSLNLEWDTDGYAVGVVLASRGYPASSDKGQPIFGIGTSKRKSNDIIFHAGTAQKNNAIVTNGGRVLVVVSLRKTLILAAQAAQEGAASVKFNGAQLRKDIAFKGIARLTKGLTYKDAGVDIASGNKLVEAIKPLAHSTIRSGVIGSIGGFGGLFDLKAAGYTDPILVSGTDGVGTKLKISQSLGSHKTIGIDLVAMCVNDVLAQGAEALFFLDYLACGKLEIPVARDLVEGVAKGCQLAGCALLGGETAEMPGIYSTSEYDLAGFAVGAVERRNLLPQLNKIEPGDCVIGVASSGVHSNGFSLIRKIVTRSGLKFSSTSPCDEIMTLGRELLKPTRIYSNSIYPIIHSGYVRAIAHITGGGLLENVPRVLPSHLGVILDASTWRIPPIFAWLAREGNVAEAEMLRTFNCGLGITLIVDSKQADALVTKIKDKGESAWIVGKVQAIKKASPQVEVLNFGPSLVSAMSTLAPSPSKFLLRKRVAVLVSGSGTNLQALIDHIQDPSNDSIVNIVLVISNVANVEGLKRAERANIPTKVIDHKQYKNRLQFDMSVHDALVSAGIEIVCLAGFMRILTGEFVRLWHGRLINIHPALLPSFKGMHAHRQALEAGVTVTGCTVHFVVEEVDAGGIIVQETVPVYPNDTETLLQERVKKVEHLAYPKALELVASGKVSLASDNHVIRNERGRK